MVEGDISLTNDLFVEHEQHDAHCVSSLPIAVQRFIEVKQATDAVYSPDGEMLFFLSNSTGTPQIWTLSADAPWPRQLSFFPDRIMSFHVCPKGQLLCMSADMSGTENAQLYLTDYEGIAVRNVTNDPAHMYQFGGWSADGHRFSYSSNKRNGRNFDVYLYDLDTETHTLVHRSEYTNHAHKFSPDGRFVLMSRSFTNLNNDVYLVNIETGELILLTAHDGEAHYGSLHFSKDGKTIFFTTNQDSEFTRVAMMDVEKKTWSYLTEDDWDAETLTPSSDGSMLAYSKNEDGTSQLYVMDLANIAEKGVSAQRILGLPSGVIGHVSWKPNTTSLAVSHNSPRVGAEVWAVDVKEKEDHTTAVTRVTYAAISGLPRSAFHEPELIHYPTFDGRMIPAYYYRPTETSGPLSVIVYVHGGPESQSRNEFNPILQYFVHRGYAVLVPNVRGSSGYGRTYVHLDDVRKRMDSVADLAKATEWLVAEGNAHKERIAVMGRSYGGFMVLAAVTHYQTLFAAGIDIVGIANFRTFMENTSPYRRHLREPEYGTVEQDGDFFDEIAPSHRVHDIMCPMFISHGANDPRVPIGEAEGIVTALRARNHPVEYVRLEDEGHGLVKLHNRILVFGEIATFLDRYVGVSGLK